MNEDANTVNNSYLPPGGGAFFWPAGHAAAETVGFATLPPGAINNVQAQVIAKVVQGNSNLKIRVIPYRGGGAVAGAVNTRRAEFGISDNRGNDRCQHRRRPVQGTHRCPICGSPSGCSPSRSAFSCARTRRSRPWRSSAASASPPSGPPFPTRSRCPMASLATGGLSLKDVKGVPTANIIRGANDFKAGKTDAFIFAVGAPKVAEVNSAVGGVRVSAHRQHAGEP